VEHFPPNFEHFPEHDHTADGQEEVYTALSGAATLHVAGERYDLVPGTFARVGPGVTRRITTGDQPVQLLAIGGTPGRSYVAPAFTEDGAPLPGRVPLGEGRRALGRRPSAARDPRALGDPPSCAGGCQSGEHQPARGHGFQPRGRRVAECDR
jgi:hypothetical protein